MEKRSQNVSERGSKATAGEKPKNTKKMSGYGRQLREKQKVKEMYGMRERQFRRFFKLATLSNLATGEELLSMLERRLDNVVFRLKLAVTRAQARQIIVHGHILVNGHKVYSPSYLVVTDEEVSLATAVESKTAFVSQVVDKRLNTGVKVPEWVELDKKGRKGRILRLPVRADIQTPIEEHLIVELYSK